MVLQPDRAIQNAALSRRAESVPDAAGAQRLSLAHRVWRLLPAGPRRAWAARVAGALAPAPRAPPPRNAPGLAVVGELDRESGLGEGARLTIAALRAAGIACVPIPIGDRRTLPPPGMPVLMHVNAPQMAGALLRLHRRLTEGRRVIGYWAWELPTLPPAWRAGARFAHEIWVPSDFTAAAMTGLACGKARVVPHPVAVRPPAPSGLGRADFGWPDGVVVVLVVFSLASSFARKNPLGAIAAFRAACEGRSDRRLVVKLSDPHHFPEDLQQLRAAVAGCDTIRLDTRTLPRADLAAMMAAADIVLSLHRSEGFGLVPAEAMLLGRPVVATGWSGNLTFMDPGSAALVGYRLVPAEDPRRVFEAPGAVWAEPDLAEAAGWIERLSADGGLRAHLGAAGRARAQARLGPAALLAAVADLGGPDLDETA